MADVNVQVRADDVADWKLEHCCDRQQIAFVVTIGVYIFLILALWRTFILTPFKLITVYLHEISHALAAKVTCGRVEGIEVNLNEGVSLIHEEVGCAAFCQLGVRHPNCSVPFSNFCANFSASPVPTISVLRSGLSCTYPDNISDMGSAFWGMVLIVMSTNSVSVRVASGVLIASLVVTTALARNCTLRTLCLVFVVLLVTVWVLQEFTVIKILRYVILFIGTMNCMFALYDIYDDLIARRVHTSDAEKFAELYPLCPCNGVGWGVLWAIFSFLCLCVAVYLGLIILD